MSRARHGMKPKGKMNDYSGSNDPNVVKEAFKKGGGVKKEVDKPEGKKTKPRMDKRPRKAYGGGVWSAAHSPKSNTEA